MDRIDLLEAKVKQMIDLVQSLRDENRALEARLAEAESRVQAAGEERSVLDRERDEVRTRIEQLLGELDGVASTGGEGDNGDAPPDADAAHGDEEGRRAQRRSQNPVLPGLA
jgi:FtsZ-binding cell division protein ZapB